MNKFKKYFPLILNTHLEIKFEDRTHLSVFEKTASHFWK